jgi:DNA-binding transcriptional MerR regulator
MKENFSIGEVAQHIGVPQFRIKYVIEQGKVPWQGERFGTMRIFTKNDVDNLRAFFKKPKDNKKS